jgi:outer membrane protein
LLRALEAQQNAQRQQAAAARALMQPSLSLLVGGGYSGDNLAVPVLNQGGGLSGPLGGVALPSQPLNGSLSGSFYNWGAALLLRQPLYDGGRSSSAVAAADRQRELLESDEELARRRIREDISAAWAGLQTAPATINAARTAVQAGERALRDAQLRYRAQVETITEVLLVQRQLQASRAALVTALTRQALDWAILERETEPAPGSAPAQAQAAGANPTAATTREDSFSGAPGPTPQGAAVRSSRWDRGS